MEKDLRRCLLIRDIEISKLKQVITETKNELENMKLQCAEDFQKLVDENEKLKRSKQSECLTEANRKLEKEFKKLYEENKNLKNCIKSHKESDQLENLIKQNRELKLQIEEMSVKHHNELSYILGSLNRTKEESRKLNKEITDLCKQLQDLKWEIYEKDLQLADIKVKLQDSLRKTEHQEVLENQLGDLCKDGGNISMNREESEEYKQRIINLLQKNKLLTEENRSLRQQNEKLLSRHTRQTKDIANLQCVLEKSRQDALELHNDIMSNDKTNAIRGLFEEEESGQNLCLKIEELLSDNSSLKQKVKNLELSNFHKLKIITKLKLSNESKN